MKATSQYLMFNLKLDHMNVHFLFSVLSVVVSFGKRYRKSNLEAGVNPMMDATDKNMCGGDFLL